MVIYEIMSRSIWFSIQGKPGSGGNIWCDEKCPSCPFRFACFTTYMTDQIIMDITEEQYGKWVTPRFGHLRMKRDLGGII